MSHYVIIVSFCSIPPNVRLSPGSRWTGWFRDFSSDIIQTKWKQWIFNLISLSMEVMRGGKRKQPDRCLLLSHIKLKSDPKSHVLTGSMHLLELQMPQEATMWQNLVCPISFCYWSCHIPQATTIQINQNIDKLTQDDKDVVIHQSSNPKNNSIPRICRILNMLVV